MIRASRRQAEELSQAIESNARAANRELVGIFHVVASDFEPDPAPVERILARVGRQAQLQPPTDVPLARRLRFWRPAIVMGVLAVFAAMSILSKPSPPGAVAVITSALTAIEEPGKITYYKTVTRSTGSAIRPPEITEHWVDYENETQKVITTSRSGDVGAMLTKDGKTVGIEGRGSDVDVSENRAIQPFSDRLKDEIGNYRARLKESTRRLSEETIDGIDTFKVQVEPRQEDFGRVDGRKMQIVLTMNVRQDNFYPVRISAETYLVDAEGEKELLTSSTDSFEEVKLIDRASLPRDFFSLDIPPDAPYRISYGYTLKEARDFKDFDLYYLGDSFDGFTFEGRFQYENERNIKYTIEGWPRETVTVNYANNTNERFDDVPSILIWRKFDPEVLFAAVYRGGTRSVVDIDGEPATLVEKDWGRVTTRVLLMQKGGSTVQLRAGDRDALIRAAKGLKKVN